MVGWDTITLRKSLHLVRGMAISGNHIVPTSRFTTGTNSLHCDASLVAFVNGITLKDPMIYS